MIPADVASRLQVTSDAALRPVAATQEISDKLAGLVAGQKVLAEVQALLPNGTYRALINQRNITLALPFSAKAGDSLELQVTETDGKLAFAVLSRPGGEEKPAAESVSTTLSRTGQLISTLYSGAQEAKGKAAALPLTTPVAPAPPQSAEELVPLLKQAIGQSGMFYESHQAEWVEGRLPRTALLQEPQGKLSSPSAFAADPSPNRLAPQQGSQTVSDPITAVRPGSETATSNTADAAKSIVTQTSQSPTIAPQLQSLVQQQLEAMATQNFVWQGPVWPGQDMRWEIDENATQGPQGDETAPRWTTRLRMTLPRLGEIDARIQLQGNQIMIAMSAGDDETRQRMRIDGESLRNQLDAAGLTLTSMGIEALAPEEPNGDT